LLSAGIGATPVLAMLHALCSNRSNREVWWLYGARNRNEHPFAKESRGLIRALARGRSHIAYSKPEPEDQPGLDYDSRGRLRMALLDRLGVPRNADFYLCGPTSFLHGFTVGLGEWGVASARIRTEIFGAEESITPGIAPSSRPPAHLPRGSAGLGPKISFTRSGLTVPWDSRFQSVLELAEACDVPVRWSCRTGVCHTCECALIGGSVTYQPDPLEPPADGNLLTCCSQPSTDLQIDL
jgi:ferredoxin-NADP reductase